MSEDARKRKRASDALFDVAENVPDRYILGTISTSWKYARESIGTISGRSNGRWTEKCFKTRGMRDCEQSVRRTVIDA